MFNFRTTGGRDRSKNTRCHQRISSERQQTTSSSTDCEEGEQQRNMNQHGSSLENDQEERYIEAGIPPGIPTLSESMEEYEVHDNTDHGDGDCEMNTNDESGLFSDSGELLYPNDYSGLFSDSGEPLVVQRGRNSVLYDDSGNVLQDKQESRQCIHRPSTFERLISYAVDDIARTFSDPENRKSRDEGDKNLLAEQEEVDIDVEFADVPLNTSQDSGTLTTALDQSRLTVEDLEITDMNTEDMEEGNGFMGEPVILEDTPKAIPSAERKSKRKSSNKREEKQVHLKCCGHGIVWTTLALVAGIIGVYTSFTAVWSTDFVNLARPLDIAPIYEEVDQLGLFNIKVCFNQNNTEMHGCMDYNLPSTAIEGDNIFQVARLFVSLGAFFGALATGILVSSLFWESINLKPIYMTLLLAYFLQSFTMLFFDSNACSEKGCRIGRGCSYCIGASMCWIVACLATTRMDNFKKRAIYRRKIQAKLARKERRRQRRLNKMYSSDIKTAIGDDFSLGIPTQPTLDITTTDSTKYEC